MIWPFKKRELDIEFVDKTRNFYQHWPIQLAKDVKPSAQKYQKDKYGSFKFPHCPGLIDHAQVGYIIPAPIDIHVMANKAGVVCKLGSAGRGDRGLTEARRMETDIIDGFIEIQDDVPITVFNQMLPWNIFTSKNITAAILPAYYHSTFLDDLHVWPGIVDYKKFHVVNFIFTPKRKCEVHIKAGDPLLQVIPFYNKEMKAGFGPGTDAQIDRLGNLVPGDDKQYYRKHMRQEKKYVLE